MSALEILVTNDDGVASPRLAELARALSAVGHVTVVAPRAEMSGCGHGFTLRRPIPFERPSEDVVVVEGTPVDAVMIAVHGLGRSYDLVVSGVNLGLNLGVDVYYSGTVAAAREGFMQGIPSFAVSVPDEANVALACDVARRLALPCVRASAFLNVNLPRSSSPGGVELTRLGARRYRFPVERRDGRFVIGGSAEGGDGESGTDTWAIERSLVSVTPLSIDTTHADVVSKRFRALADAAALSLVAR